jgi:hypothetical protein
MKRFGHAVLFGSLLVVGGCVTEHSVHVAPIQLQPIQVTMDVNVHIQDDQADAGPADDAADEGAEATETPSAGGEAAR